MDTSLALSMTRLISMIKNKRYDTRQVNSCDLNHFLFRAKNLYVFVIWLDKSRAD